MRRVGLPGLTLSPAPVIGGSYSKERKISMRIMFKNMHEEIIEIDTIFLTTSSEDKGSEAESSEDSPKDTIMAPKK